MSANPAAPASGFGTRESHDAGCIGSRRQENLLRQPVDFLKARLGNWNASLLAAAGFLVAIGVLMAVLPSLGHLAANKAAAGSHARVGPTLSRPAPGRATHDG